jgi:hypothetical protein
LITALCFRSTTGRGCTPSGRLAFFFAIRYLIFALSQAVQVHLKQEEIIDIRQHFRSPRLSLSFFYFMGAVTL